MTDLYPYSSDKTITNNGFIKNKTVTQFNSEIIIVDIQPNGEPIRKTKQSYPYNYDGFILWKKPDSETNKNKKTCVYTDRLIMWNRKLHDKCCEEVWNNKSQYWNNRTPEDIQKFLSLYYSNYKNIELLEIDEYCNPSNGYPVWVLSFSYETI